MAQSGNSVNGRLRSPGSLEGLPDQGARKTRASAGLGVVMAMRGSRPPSSTFPRVTPRPATWEENRATRDHRARLRRLTHGLFAAMFAGRCLSVRPDEVKACSCRRVKRGAPGGAPRLYSPLLDHLSYLAGGAKV